ncbi:MAG: AI-2E family transporter [Tissierellia bacterium]|nr:AI-2E family transporter [Tissierellia bacterium]
MGTDMIMNYSLPPLTNIIRILIAIFLVFSIYYLINIGNRYLERSKRVNFNIKRIFKIIALIVFLYLIHKIFQHFTILGKVVTIFFSAAIIAYVLNPLVEMMEEKGFSRKLSIIIIYASIVLIFAIIIMLFAPRTAKEVKNLAVEMPSYIDRTVEFVSNLNDKLVEILGSSSENIANEVSKNITEIGKQLQVKLLDFISGATQIVTAFLGKVVTFFLIMIVAFFFIVDKDFYLEKIKSIIPSKYEDDIYDLGNSINKALYEFVRGRLLMAVFVGVATTIVLLIMRIEFALVIGILTMICDIIPYIGPFIAFTPAFLFALLDSPMKALWLTIFFVLIQWAENNILGPKILGDSTGLPPLVIFFTIIIGGGIFGVWGMVISVPLLAIMIILGKFAYAKYKKFGVEDKEIDKFKTGRF